MRIDLTLLGWKGLKGIRGNLSLLFKGRRHAREGQLLVVNHNTKTVESVFAEQSDETIEEIINEMMKEQENSKLIETAQFSLTPVINGGKQVTQAIEGYVCKKYTAQYTTLYAENETEGNISIELPIKNQSFLQYFTESRSLIEIPQSANNVQGNIAGNIDEYLESIHKTACWRKGGQSSNIVRTNKGAKADSIEATVWLCSNYPIKYNQIASVMNVLSYTSPHIAKFVDIIAQNHFDSQGFPIKLSIPLFCTMKAYLVLRNLQIKSVPEEFMNIDSKYLSKQPKGTIPTQLTKAHLYSPISTSDWKRASAPNQIVQKTEAKGEAIDRFQWSSDESEENDESLLRAKIQYESLLKIPDPISVPPIEEIKKIASDPPPEIKKEEKNIQKEEDSEEIDILIVDDICSINKPNYNVSAHCIKAIKTLKEVLMNCTPKMTEISSRGSQLNNGTHNKLEKRYTASILEPKREPNDILNDSARTIKKVFVGKNISQALCKVRKKQRTIAQTYIETSACHRIPPTEVKVKMPQIEKKLITTNLENPIKSRPSNRLNKARLVFNASIDALPENKFEDLSRNKGKQFRFDLQKKKSLLSYTKKTLDVDVDIKK